MEKIVIIGSAGSGKSTLAQKLGPLLNIEPVHLDRIFWQPGWKEKPREQRIDILQSFVYKQKRWIIEGAYLGSSEPRLDAADTIIFLDIPPLTCLWRIIRRHFKYHGHSRRDIPEGCTDKFTPISILKVLAFPLLERRKLKAKLQRFPSGKVLRLRSANEVEGFLTQLELHVGQRRQSSKKSSVAERKHLTAARQLKPLSPLRNPVVRL
jgi:adenylate kinase family enzyme